MKKIKIPIGRVTGINLIGETELDKSRLPVVAILMFGSMLILVVRLVFLQVIRGGELRVSSDNNRIVMRSVPAPRGVIQDRKGVRLVINQPRTSVLVDEEGRLLPEPKLISREEALLRHATESGVLIEELYRLYPWGPYAAHLVGYVGEVGDEEVSQGLFKIGEWVGKTGLEKSYDDSLRGQSGSELVEVDAQGRLLRRVQRSGAVPGTDLTLSVDMGLQRVFLEKLAGRKGAVVATNPQTGEILAMISSPSFDTNWFSKAEVLDKEKKEWRTDELGIKNDSLESILEDQDQPLLNRSISGGYPPGSVFKVVTAIAGLEMGKITPESEIEDIGEIRINQYRFGNWYYLKYGKTEGMVDLKEALSRSNDIYFYKIGEWVGVDGLAEWAENFGFGEKTGVSLPGEISGLVPSELWKERVKGEKWFLGNTYHLAIGQGDLLVTPMQVNQMMGVIANGGRWCSPSVVVKLGERENGQVNCREVNIKSEFITEVRQGLERACQLGGTAFPFFNFDLGVYGGEYTEEGRNKVACKTGTAQHFGGEVLPHAWFSVFAPAINPEIQVTVLLEAEGEGSEKAAPVALEGLKYWFENKNKN